MHHDISPTNIRIRMALTYDGTDYHGWAVQPGLPTIQETVEDGLALIFRVPVRLTVAGRTDAGVHAQNQVVHFDVPSDVWQQLPGKNKPQRRPEAALVSKLNGVLARQNGAIRILDAGVAPDGFDARFSPVSRSYQYRIELGQPNPLTRHFTYFHRREIDVDLMAEEIAGLEGLHDFGSFCKPRPGATTVRDLHRFELETNADGVLLIHLSADAFCHHMVRALVGALIQVGDGTKPAGWLLRRLAEPTRDSHMQLAPPHGLMLAAVNYPPDDDVAARAAQTRARRDAPMTSMPD